MDRHSTATLTISLLRFHLAILVLVCAVSAEAQVGKRAMKLGVGAAKNFRSIAVADRPIIPRPPHWGGIRVWPRRIELWIEGADRIHDRARWERSLLHHDDDTFTAGEWTGTRLQP